MNNTTQSNGSDWDLITTFPLEWTECEIVHLFLKENVWSNILIMHLDWIINIKKPLNKTILWMSRDVRFDSPSVCLCVPPFIWLFRLPLPSITFLELLIASNMFHCTQLNASTRNNLKDLEDLTYAQRSTNNWSC